MPTNRLRPKDFRVSKQGNFTIAKRPTRVDPYCQSKEEFAERLAKNVKELSSLQNLLYADNRSAVLVIFQAMDAAGKDSAIKHVFSGVNPQGCQVYSFKQPSAEELEHDFLWRATCRLPARGNIGVFNRSYYEDVLVVRVHEELLASQLLPKEVLESKNLWNGRYDSIIALENHLSKNGTTVIKIFLHLSKDEQRKRFLRRIEDPEKNWKFNSADITERKHWNEYMKAYEACIRATSSEVAPWYVVPADDKKNAQIIISEIIVDTMKRMELSYPKLDAAQVKELRSLHKVLEK